MYRNHLINLHTSFHNMNSYTSFIPCYGSWLDLRWNSGSGFIEDPVDWSLWVPTHLNWFSIEVEACKEEGAKMRSNGRGQCPTEGTSWNPTKIFFFFFFAMFPNHGKTGDKEYKNCLCKHIWDIPMASKKLGKAEEELHSVVCDHGQLFRK